MTRSLYCKNIVDPTCTHTIYGETEDELLQNVKKHGMEVHGYTEQTWNKEIAKKGDRFRSTSKKRKKAKQTKSRQKGKTKSSK